MGIIILDCKLDNGEWVGGAHASGQQKKRVKITFKWNVFDDKTNFMVYQLWVYLD